MIPHHDVRKLSLALPDKELVALGERIYCGGTGPSSGCLCGAGLLVQWCWHSSPVTCVWLGSMPNTRRTQLDVVPRDGIRKKIAW
jgi:hypothetical protein